jgi:flagellar protein FlaG
MDNISSLEAAPLSTAKVEAQQPPVRSLSPTMTAQVLGLTGSQVSDKGADKSASVELDNESLHELVERANQQYHSRSISLNFAVDEEAGRTVITVTDMNTEKLIRQIPTDEILALIRNIRKMQGTLFDTEA